MPSGTTPPNNVDPRRGSCEHCSQPARPACRLSDCRQSTLLGRRSHNTQPTPPSHINEAQRRTVSQLHAHWSCTLTSHLQTQWTQGERAEAAVVTHPDRRLYCQSVRGPNSGGAGAVSQPGRRLYCQSVGVIYTYIHHSTPATTPNTLRRGTPPGSTHPHQ